MNANTPRGLSSRSAAERVEALRAREADLAAARDTRRRELEQAIQATNTKHAADVTAARAEVEATLDRCEREIAEDLKRTLYPLAAKAGDAPRATALPIAECWRKLSARTKEETGHDLDAFHLALAMVASHGEEALASAAGDRELRRHTSGNLIASAVVMADRTLRQEAPVTVLEQSIRDLDQIVCSAIVNCRTRVTEGTIIPSRERARVMQSAATSRGIEDALRTHDAKVAEVAKQRTEGELRARMAQTATEPPSRSPQVSVRRDGTWA